LEIHDLAENFSEWTVIKKSGSEVWERIMDWPVFPFPIENAVD